MAKGGQGQQGQPVAQQQQNNAVAPVQKRYKGLRITLIIVAILLLIASVVLGLLIANKTISDSWGTIFTYILAGLGILITIFAWVWPFPADSSDGDSGQAQINPTISPNISPTFNISFPFSSGMMQSNVSHDMALPVSPVASSTIPTNSNNTSSVIGAYALFLPNLPLRNSDDFHGRELARAKVVRRMRMGGSTSIIGPRRIGKTWLLNYVLLVAAREIGAQVRIGYMDVSWPGCATVRGFVAAALKALNMHTSVTKSGKLTLKTLQNIVEDVPGGVVLCLDEFEGFGSHPQVFDYSFFTELRSLMGPPVGLTLITASKSSLIDLVSKQTSTSPFFNKFEQETLKPFDKIEADSFIVSRGNKAGFSVEEQGYLRKCGSEFGQKGQQWPPLRLQLAGNILLTDKEQAGLHGAVYFRPHDSDYWQDFQERLEDKYRAVM